MAWRYPTYDLKTDYVVDISQINENFLSVVEEVSGLLNEHNFSAKDSAVLSRANLANNAAFTLHYSTPESPVPGVRDYGGKANWMLIQGKTDGWQTFSTYTPPGGSERSAEGLSLEFVATGGMTWICASFNIHCGTGEVPEDPDFQKGFGYLCALELDGVILNESLLGSGDLDQEEFARGALNRAWKDIPLGGGGISAARLPIVLDTVVDLLPGRHVIKVAITNIRGRMWADADSSKTWISTRELFALELIR
jgi:hypothetical protein